MSTPKLQFMGAIPPTDDSPKITMGRYDIDGRAVNITVVQTVKDEKTALGDLFKAFHNKHDRKIVNLNGRQHKAYCKYPLGRVCISKLTEDVSKKQIHCIKQFHGVISLEKFAWRALEVAFKVIRKLCDELGTRTPFSMRVLRIERKKHKSTQRIVNYYLQLCIPVSRRYEFPYAGGPLPLINVTDLTNKYNGIPLSRDYEPPYQALGMTYKKYEGKQKIISHFIEKLEGDLRLRISQFRSRQSVITNLLFQLIPHEEHQTERKCSFKVILLSAHATCGKSGEATLDKLKKMVRNSHFLKGVFVRRAARLQSHLYHVFCSACQEFEKNRDTRIPFEVKLYSQIAVDRMGYKTYQVGVELFVPKNAATPEELKTLIMPTLRILDNERLEEIVSSIDTCSIQ